VTILAHLDSHCVEGSDVVVIFAMVEVNQNVLKRQVVVALQTLSKPSNPSG